jgi:hypothetical protein
MQSRVVLPRKEIKPTSRAFSIGITMPLNRFSEKDAVRSRDFVLIEHMDMVADLSVFALPNELRRSSDGNREAWNNGELAVHQHN